MEISRFLLSRQSQEEAHDQKSISLACPTSDHLRVTYALVTCHLRIDEECDNQEPVAVITVIHLPDDFCRSPAVTLSQFLKFKDNRLLNLKVSTFVFFFKCYQSETIAICFTATLFS